MIYSKHYLSIITILGFIFMSCSSESKDSDDNSTGNGNITLSGEETSIFGSTLQVAKTQEGAYNTGTSKSITLLHKSIDIDEDGDITPSTASFTESFIIVVAQFTDEDYAAAEKTISMIIIKNGKEYRYTCTSKFGGGSDDFDCGENFDVNQTENEVIFKNTTVINADTNKTLTLNGTVSY
ncbi:hypothetical protein [Algibacter sp. Ld11]|uniref:hypothetical protein n=1 Tax=Algibacter sp. Ld11 TaxID=649150 RepID=UPI00386571F6